MPEPIDEASVFVRNELPDEVQRLQQVEEVVFQSPQRDQEEIGCEPIGLVVRFAKWVKPDEAERLLRKARNRVLKRWHRLCASPELRQERRERKQARQRTKKLRRATQRLERQLGFPA